MGRNGRCISPYNISMKRTVHSYQKGFTLIEILLYLSLSIVMVALIGGIGVNVLTGLTGSKAEEELQYNAQFVTEKIHAIVSAAKNIELPSARETSPGLILRMNDPKKDPTVIDVVDGRIRVKEGESDPWLLSGKRLIVLTPVFSNVTYAGGPGSVRIILPMELVNPQDRVVLRASTTLYTTINLQYP
jgi:hypothetical protein